MKKTITWIRQNKLSSLLLIVLGYFLLSGGVDTPFERQYNKGFLGAESFDMAMSAEPMMARSESLAGMPPIEEDFAPSTSTDRLVIKDTDLSLKVDDVAGSITNIENVAVKYGGFLVNSSLDVPEQAATGNITVRVETQNLQKALDEIKGFAVKVVSENVTGRDVTDQYEDLDERLTTLENTRLKFQSIFDNAVEISDILEVQRQLISIQSQIDSIKGRQEYLEKSASLTRITIYLSTDEYALPYTPSESWRPGVIVKDATRSLVRTARGFLSAGIWAIVYAPVWLLGLLVIWIINKKLK